MWKPVLTSVLAIGLGAGLTACRGDDDGGDALTKDEFIAAADDICEEMASDMDALFTDLGEDATFEELQATTRDEAIPIAEDVLDDLRALNPPEADEDTIEALLNDFDEAVQTVKAQAEMTEEELSAVEEDAFADVDAAAREYGFDTCGAEEDA